MIAKWIFFCKNDPKLMDSLEELGEDKSTLLEYDMEIVRDQLPISREAKIIERALYDKKGLRSFRAKKVQPTNTPDVKMHEPETSRKTPQIQQISA